MDHIALQIPGEKRLARVVRAAVAAAARGSGIPGGRATTFASAVARRFAALTSRRDGSRAPVSLSLDQEEGGLAVRIDPGAGRRGAVLRIAKDRPRTPARPRAPRSRRV